jgi:hypothetical protein
MSCLSSTRRAELQAELLTLQGYLTDLETAYSASLTGGIKSYKFDSGEAAQAVVYQSSKELKEQIDDVKAEITAINRKLNGTNLKNLNLRRQSGVVPRGGRGY